MGRRLNLVWDHHQQDGLKQRGADDVEGEDDESEDNPRQEEQHEPSIGLQTRGSAHTSDGEAGAKLSECGAMVAVTSAPQGLLCEPAVGAARGLLRDRREGRRGAAASSSAEGHCCAEASVVRQCHAPGLLHGHTRCRKCCE